MKKYEPVAYSDVQYAPALCIWREIGDTDAIHWGTYTYTRVGYMDDAGQPTSVLHWSRVYTSSKGDFVRYNNRRYYLHDFIKM